MSTENEAFNQNPTRIGLRLALLTMPLVSIFDQIYIW